MAISPQTKEKLEKLYKLLNTNFDRAFGLDISDTSIELAELSKLFRFSLENFGRIELPEDVIVEGRILNETALTEHIKTLMVNVKPRRVSTNKVILSLPETQIFTHHFTLLTPLRKDALRLLVQKEIVKILPISPMKMYWDIKTTELLGGQVSVVFVGIQKEVAESYVRVCNNVGLSIIGFGLEPLSIARLLIPDGPEVTAIVDIGSRITNISVIKGNADLFLTISYFKGGKAMTEAIAQGQNIDNTLAEQKKVAVGSGTSDEIFFLIEPVIKEIGTEIKRVIEYYETTFNGPINKILLVGGASIMGGVKEKIGQITGKPIDSMSNFNNLENVQYLSSKKYGAEESTPILYTSVIGLGMLGASNEFEDINLLKQIPSSKINDIRRAELFNGGYLSKLTAFRIFLNSRIMLAVSVTLACISVGLFGFLIFKYKLNEASRIKVYRTVDSGAFSQSSTTPVFGGVNASSTATSTNGMSTSTRTLSGVATTSKATTTATTTKLR